MWSPGLSMHVSLTDVRVEVEHGEDALAHVTECSLAFVPSLFKCLCLHLCVLPAPSLVCCVSFFVYVCVYRTFNGCMWGALAWCCFAMKMQLLCVLWSSFSCFKFDPKIHVAISCLWKLSYKWLFLSMFVCFYLSSVCLSSVCLSSVCLFIT